MMQAKLQAASSRCRRTAVRGNPDAPAARCAAHRYRSLGVDVSTVSTVEAHQRKVAKKRDAREMKSKVLLLMKSNVIRNLPNNVPY
jgi:hypothetical protein